MPISFSAQDIHALPSRGVPLIIKRDTEGRQHIRTRNVLGRVKIAVLRSMGHHIPDAHDTRTQFHSFLRDHYGEHSANDAFRRAAISAERPPKRDLTSHQARLALSYAQQNRFKNIQENRRLAENLMPAAGNPSQHYKALQAGCALLHPSVDTGTLKPEQWAYVRKSLVRYLNVYSRNGRVRISEDKALVLASHIVGQAHALGAQGCARVVSARRDMNRAMAEFFTARTRNDNSNIVGQLLRISQKLEHLQQAETAHAHPAAQAYVNQVYSKDAVSAMTAYLEDNVKSAHDSSRFHHVLSSLSRDNLPQVLRSLLEAQKAQQALSQSTVHRLERATKMLTHMQQELGVYSATKSPKGASSGMSELSYRALTDQMRAYGAVAPLSRHHARVRMAHRALQQAQDAMLRGSHLPAALAVSTQGQGHAKNRASLNFMRQALESALEGDRDVQEMRRRGQRYMERQNMPRSQRPESFLDDQNELINSMDKLKQKLFQSDSAYLKLYNALAQFTAQRQNRNPTPASVEEKQYQEGLNKLLNLYDTENLGVLPRDSHFDWDSNGHVRLVRSDLKPPEDGAQRIEQEIAPSAKEQEWQQNGKNMGVSDQFARDVMRTDIILDDFGQRKNIRDSVQQKPEAEGLSNNGKITMAVTQFHEFVDNREHAFFLSQLLNQTLGNQGTVFIKKHASLADSVLTHVPIAFAQKLNKLSMSLSKQANGGYTIDYECRFNTVVLTDSLGGSGNLQPTPDSGWSMSYRIHISPQDLANRTFHVDNLRVGASTAV